MPAPRTRRGNNLRSRPFIATVFLISLLAASSFVFKTPHHAIGLYVEDAGTGTELIPRGKQIECNRVQSSEDQCSFVKKHCEDEDAGLLPYLEWYYCAPSQMRPVAFILLVVWLGLLFTTIGIAASDFFSVNLSTIATILGLSESLAGVTFLAFGNGSPDVFSTFAAMNSNSPGMAVGELIGAASFITGVVAGSMALVREFKVDKKTYARDICFFIVAVAFSMLFLADGRLRFWECWAMVGYYVVYVFTVVGWHWYTTRRKRRLHREAEARSHYCGRIGRSHSGDGLAGEPYRDELENSLRRDLGRDSRNASANGNPTLEHGARIELDGQSLQGDYGVVNCVHDNEEHERMIAAEVSRSMRVLRPGRTKSYALNPIRPSLVGALEFRSALAQLQRESNLQLSHIPGRSQSDYFQARRSRRGTTSEVAEGGLWETISTPGESRDRASSFGGALSVSAPPAPNVLAEEASIDTSSVVSKNNNTSLAVPGQTPSARSSRSSTPFMVGGNLAPPPIGYFGTVDDGKLRDGEDAHDKHAGSLKLLIPSQRSSHSGASSPSSPFPRYTDSPAVITPHVASERTEFMLPQAGLSRREDSYAEIQVPTTGGRRLYRWWPYSLLPPPHVVFATLFPTLQGWRDKTIWDKFLSTISVPSIFLLVITLPVVESEASGEEDGGDGCSAVHQTAIQESSHLLGISHPAPNTPFKPQEYEAEGEWERYRWYSRRSSVLSNRPSSPELLVRQEQRGSPVLSPGAVPNGGPTTVAKPVSDIMASFSHENDTPAGSWNRWLVCVQLFTGPLFAILILWANMQQDLLHPAKTLVRMVLYTLAASLVLLGCLFVMTSEHKRPKYHFLLCFMGFVISIAWISTIAGEVVGVLKTFGIILNISEALLGLTIFAAGNSVGDLVADITVARLGYPVMALSACFGGPMLNILLGIGIGGVLMMVQHANKKHAKHPEQPIQYGPYSVEVGPTLLVSTVTLLITLVLLLIVVPLNNWVLSRKIGWGLMALWTLSTIANVVVELSGVWRES
ncbi:hypothetical protein E4U52_000065 [Claviceps spartinae]|nr:hypothetical protein E4U52_000065 [Claviceps spartinae]